jgi:hypothetical protein
MPRNNRLRSQNRHTRVRRPGVRPGRTLVRVAPRKHDQGKVLARSRRHVSQKLRKHRGPSLCETARGIPKETLSAVGQSAAAGTNRGR